MLDSRLGISQTLDAKNASVATDQRFSTGGFAPKSGSRSCFQSQLCGHFLGFKGFFLKMTYL